MKRRILSTLVAACMLFSSMAPVSAFAEELQPAVQETAQVVAEAPAEEPAPETPAEEPAAEPVAEPAPEAPAEEPAAEPAPETPTEEPVADPAAELAAAAEAAAAEPATEEPAAEASAPEAVEEEAPAEVQDAIHMASAGTLALTLTNGGGEPANTDYTYADGVLTILTATPMTVSGTSADRIAIANGITADLTLNGVNITNNASGTGVIDVGTGTLNLRLATGSTNAVKATNDYEAGIWVRPEATLNVYGDDTASLTAEGVNCGAGIGGMYVWAGSDGSCGTIHIFGGNITAKNPSRCAVGGVYEGNGGNVTISGGLLTAEAWEPIGADIRMNGTLTVKNDAVVIATKRGDPDSEFQIPGLTLTQGIVSCNGNATVGGDATLSASLSSIAEGKIGTIPEGTSLTIPEGLALTVDGNLYNNGTLINNGTLDGDGLLMANGVDESSTGTTTLARPEQGTGTIDVSEGDVRLFATGYQVGDTIYSYDMSQRITLTGTTTEHKVFMDSGLTLDLMLSDLNIDRSGSGVCHSALDLTGCTVDLHFTGANKLQGTSDRPGICLQDGAAVTINSDSGTLETLGTMAIAAHDDYHFGTCTIESGNITVGGSIGRERESSNGTVNITGGNVTVAGGTSGLAAMNISGGKVRFGGTVDADSFTTGTDGTAEIDVGGSIKNQSHKTGWSGIISENGGQKTVYGTQTLAENYTVDNGLLVPAGATLVVPSGVTLTNNSIINVYGTLTVNGTYAGDGLLFKKDGGTLDGNNAPSVSNAPANPTIDITGAKSVGLTAGTYTLNGVEYPYTGTATITGSTNCTLAIAKDVTAVTLDGVNITAGPAVDLAADTNITITLKNENTLTIPEIYSLNNKAALHVPESATLVLEGNGTGSLVATGGHYDYANGDAAAIGGNIYEAAGTITIQNCTVTAHAMWADAIGGGSDGRAAGAYFTKTPTKPVTITNSIVTANSDRYDGIKATNVTVTNSVVFTDSIANLNNESKGHYLLRYRWRGPWHLHLAL